jgi:hypothetical protein
VRSGRPIAANQQRKRVSFKHKTQRLPSERETLAMRMLFVHRMDSRLAKRRVSWADNAKPVPEPAEDLSAMDIDAGAGAGANANTGESAAGQSGTGGAVGDVAMAPAEEKRVKTAAELAEEKERELERLKEEELARAKQQELLMELEAERKREAELERQRELQRLAELELEKKREKEREIAREESELEETEKNLKEQLAEKHKLFAQLKTVLSLEQKLKSYEQAKPMYGTTRTLNHRLSHILACEPSPRLED